MAWTYVIRTHCLYRPDGTLQSDDGWAGHDAGGVKAMNNPDCCHMRGIGPLPPGDYRMDVAINHPHLGPVAIRLSYISGQSFGRSGFWVHGANAAHPLLSSDGCITEMRVHREAMDADNDAVLRVVAEEQDRASQAKG